MPRVVIIQSFIKGFRVPFYELLRERLEAHGVELRVVFGQPDRFHEGDADVVTQLPFGTRTHNLYLYFNGTSLAWQPALGCLGGADLVVVQQGNRHLLNHVLLVTRRVLGFKLAFWGHAKNFQAHRPAGLREQFKRAYSCRADHWFAYTERSRAVLSELGYPAERITTVQNAIDTMRLMRDYESLSDDEVASLAAELGMAAGDVAAVFCSRLYGLKEIDFLLACAREIRRREGRFHLIVVGDGPEAWKVRQFCRGNGRWAHWVGRQFGRQKAKYFRLAACQVMPGAVGLNIVDSLALLTPLITRDIPTHGPEVEYLQDGLNGMITLADPESYTRGVLVCLRDESLRQRLVRGCENTRGRYTVENMADRFSEGLCRALAMKPHSHRAHDGRNRALPAAAALA